MRSFAASKEIKQIVYGTLYAYAIALILTLATVAL